MKHEELKEAFSQAHWLENYVEQFKNGQDYQELKKETFDLQELVTAIVNARYCKCGPL